MPPIDSTQPQQMDWYATESGVFDEMWNGQAVNPHWRYFIQSLQELGLDEMERRRQEAIRLLRENGVTYNIYSDPQGYQRIWDLDPIPTLIDSQEWSEIEAGLVERAELLNLILTDLYGPRELIKLGLLPLELIYSHSGFIRACDQVQPDIPNQLILYAADLVRNPMGNMFVISDRTQSPSGAGYALENRTVTSRIVPSLFRDSQVHRLSLFFHSLRQSLRSLAPLNKDDPRVVVLTPGPFNEAYFEHAYLAAYLGFNLVHGDNLVVQNGKVWLKAVGGLQQVDVILRRVDDHYCDPVELRTDSRLGVPGLLDAARQGNVVIANPLGSSVLENPGLMAFLPAIAKHYFGKELKLPSVATWWCGQASARKYVLENLDKLLIKPVSRQPGTQSVFGCELSSQELQQWRERISAKPNQFVAQEFIPFSTVPSLIDGKAEPRHAVLRSFIVSNDKDYTVMPGGLTRTALQPGNYRISNQAGCMSKDTWVLASEPEKQVSLWSQVSESSRMLESSALPSRAADNLYWVGRYVERAEGTARLLRTVLHRYADNDEFSTPANRECLNIFLRALTSLTATYPGFIGEGAEKKLTEPEKHLSELILSRDLPGSLASTLGYFQGSAYAVRDRWSNDMWRVVENLDVTGRTNRTTVKPIHLAELQDNLDELLGKLSTFSGLAAESMTHDNGWYFMDIGRRLERSILLANLLSATCVYSYDMQIEAMMLEDLLITIENLITYRRHYRSGLQRYSVLQLLLLNEENPRSLIYQLNTLQKQLARLPREQSKNQLSDEERHVIETYTHVRLIDLNQLLLPAEQGMAYPQLHDFLQGVIQSASRASNAITDNYFNYGEGPRPLWESDRIPNP